jgi:hypothetical protein
MRNYRPFKLKSKQSMRNQNQVNPMNPKPHQNNPQCLPLLPQIRLRKSHPHQLVCDIDGCGGKRVAKGFCHKHYRRLRNHGDALAPVKFHVSRGVHMAWIESHRGYDGDDCLVWPFGEMKHKYRTVKKDGVTRGVHCVMCELRHGQPPTPQHEVAHSCGNGTKGCVAPNHLSWKTHAENEADKIVHGTHNRGERHPLAKLTTADVLEIRKTQGVTQYILADRYGVSQSAISLIKLGKLWKCLGQEASHV